MNPDPVLLRTLWRRAERPGLVDPRLARTLTTRHERMVAGLPLAEILTRHTGTVPDPSAATVPIVYALVAGTTHDKPDPSRELPATSPPLPVAPARPTPPQSRPVAGTTHDKPHPSRELPATSPPPPASPGSTPATKTPSTADTTAPRHPEPARATPPDPPATPTIPTSYPLVAGSSPDKSHLSRELPATSPPPPAVSAPPASPGSTPATNTSSTADTTAPRHPEPARATPPDPPATPTIPTGNPLVAGSAHDKSHLSRELPATSPAPPAAPNRPGPPDSTPVARPSVPRPATSTSVIRPGTPASYPLVAGSSHDKTDLSREVPATSPPAVLAPPASPGRTPPAHPDASATGNAAPFTRPAAPALPVVPARQPVRAPLDRPLETMTHRRSPSPAQPLPLPLVDLAVATARTAETHPAADPVPHRAPPAAPARDTAGQPIRQPNPSVDIGQIVDAVHRRFLRRLAVESERRGVR
jgi:hypothetical protein